MQRKLYKKDIKKLYDLLLQRWPDAHCELDHDNAFQLLVAVVLSAQTTDIAVNKALLPLRKAIPNFEAHDILQLGENNFFEIIKSIGLAKTKAKNIIKTSQIIVDNYSGIIPQNFDDLLTLPGVGRKSANVICNVLFGVGTMPVDTHVSRVSQRTGLVQPTTDLYKIEQALLGNTPKKFATQAHHLLVFLGRYVCKSRNPQCDNCPIESICLKNLSSL